MIALAAQQPLIPPAARLHIRYGNQGLRTHSISVAIHTELPIASNTRPCPSQATSTIPSLISTPPIARVEAGSADAQP